MVRGGRRAAEGEAARLVKEANEGKVPLERETLTGFLARWFEHTEAPGRAPKTLLENRRMAVITEELGEKELRKVRGRDLDGFYNRLRRRGLPGTSVRRYHAVLSASQAPDYSQPLRPGSPSSLNSAPGSAWEPSASTT